MSVLWTQDVIALDSVILVLKPPVCQGLGLGLETRTLGLFTTCSFLELLASGGELGGTLDL